MACQGCASILGNMKCNICRNACQACGSCVVGFHTKPLSSYVIVSFLLSGVCGYIAYAASTEDNTCKYKDDAMFQKETFCYILLATAVVNVVFAVYFQMQVWAKIKETISTDGREALEIEAEGYASKLKNQGGGLLGKGLAAAGRAQAETPQSAEAEAGSHERLKIKAKTVQDSFVDTFKKDFGVLIFFLASLGIVFLCYQAKGFVATGTGCSDKEMEGWSYYTGFGFFTVPFIYTLMWYCCTCCAKAANITQEEADKLLEEGGRGDFQRVAQDSEGQ